MANYSYRAPKKALEAADFMLNPGKRRVKERDPRMIAENIRMLFSDA